MTEYVNEIARIDDFKKKIDAYRPLTLHITAQLKSFYRISLTYSSNALEGNSLTESETKVVIEDGLTIGGKPLRDHLEAQGHSHAYDLLLTLSESRHNLTEAEIQALHRLFYQAIDAGQAGNYRSQKVIITGTSFIPPAPALVPQLMLEWVSDSNRQKSSLHPVVYAAKLHLEFVGIHPFIDGNGRTARLLMNLALIQSGYPITIIPPILRSDYITCLRQAQTTAKNEIPFINFISHCVLESSKEYLRLLASLV